ncbi:PDR/VanB family oxidoreductase [Rhodococcus artemisiae]|uniref:PDR/VanB family oxidoreductase n=1 Tax=Rhodococcus artemisiae TaxID=714159 RepID=A0ABU7LJE1_9NOCA|nr:PDR/VanB family oxidoreductase [Rhodococcus artemisiae]MEE2061685.1 PDR/VanB family oxidoreductase [Rhodococcus artemisiae]
MVAKTDSEQTKMQVIGKDVLAEGVVMVRFADPDGGCVPAWEPGSHIDVIIDESTVRQYSLCGDPADDTCLAVAVLREDSGRGGSRWVHDSLQIGDLVSIAGPRNNFTLESAPSYLFVAGGIGITPMLPMLRAADASGADWRLLYGGRTRASMAFAEDLVAEYPDRVELRPQDEYGHLDLAAALDALDEGTGVYCCGPEPLLQAIENECRGRSGVTLHVERFAAKERPADALDDTFEVELRQSGTTVAVDANETLLDAVLRSGIDVPFSCREGTCGTCETAVLEGIPDHRDSVLTEDEQAENNCMMICVSRSCTAKLTLDL